MNSLAIFAKNEIKDAALIAAATYGWLLVTTKVVIPLERKYRKNRTPAA